MVPDGWKQTKLNNICTTVTSGSRDWAKYYSDSGAKFIRMTNLSRGDIWLNLSDLKFVDVQSDSSDGRRTSLRYGDILMSITAELGKIGWVHEGLGEAYINQHTALIRVEPTKAHSKFIAYLLSSRKMNARINRLNDSGAKAGLNLPTIRSIPLTVPAIPIQKKISQILSTWDKAITTTEQLLANSQQQKKALMQQLLTGKKRLLDENGVRFSGEWNRYKLKDIGNTFSGLTGKSKADFGKGTPYIPYKNIFKNSRIDLSELDYVEVNEGENQTAVKFGDIFFTTSSEVIEEVGMSSVLLDDVEALYLNSFCFGFRLNDFETLTPQFAQHLFRSESSRRKISKLGQGATRYNLSKKQLTTRFEFKVPPINEQIRIASVLSNADNVTAQLSKQLTRLKYEKKALMQQLLTGKRRVKVDKVAA